MAQAELPASRLPIASHAAWLADGLRAAGPPLLFGLRLWASVCLALYVAFWLELDNAYSGPAPRRRSCAGRPHLGASLRKGWYRLIGTGDRRRRDRRADRVLSRKTALRFLVGLALWGAGCAFVATLLKNFAAYSSGAGWRTPSRSSRATWFSATGGPNGREPSCSPSTARAKICIGIVCAGVVLAVTDFGQTQRRLATLFAAISSEITGRFAGTLADAGADFDDTQRVRREFTRRRSSRSTR